MCVRERYKNARTKIVRESWRCSNAICLSTYANGSPSVANTLNKRITQQQKRNKGVYIYIYMYTYRGRRLSTFASISRRDAERGEFKREQWKSEIFAICWHFLKSRHTVSFIRDASRRTLVRGMERKRGREILERTETIIEGQMLNALAKCSKCSNHESRTLCLNSNNVLISSTLIHLIIMSFVAFIHICISCSDFISR